MWSSPDNDEAGRKHADQVVGFLSGVAKRVRVLPLPGLAEKGDVADWVAAGGTAAKLEELAALVGEQPPPARSEADYDSPGREQSQAKPSEARYDDCADRRRDERHAQTDGDAQVVDLITEGSVAAAFAHEHRFRLRYCHHIGSWFLWDETRWKREETRLAFRWAHQQAKILAARYGRRQNHRHRRKGSLRGGRRAQGPIRSHFCRHKRRMGPRPMAARDTGGTVDLRTCIHRPARSEDYITKTTSVVPGDQATVGDMDFARFLQQWFGDRLTGITREHALPFIYGLGGNGKSVLSTPYPASW